MQPLPRYEEPERGRVEPTKPRVRRTLREEVSGALASAWFWGGLSVLVALVSLALPWWGVTVVPSAYSSSWGLFFGPQSQSTNVDWFPQRIDALFAPNYSFMTGIVLVTAGATALGAILRRQSVLVLSIILSGITILSFLSDVGNALSLECSQIGGVTCISGIIGNGTSGSSLVTWGFQAGFYTFIVSSILVLVAMAIPKK